MPTMEEIKNNRREVNGNWIASHLTKKQEYALLAVHPNIMVYPLPAFVLAIRQTLSIGMDGKPLFEIMDFTPIIERKI